MGTFRATSTPFQAPTPALRLLILLVVMLASTSAEPLKEPGYPKRSPEIHSNLYVDNGACKDSMERLGSRLSYQESKLVGIEALLKDLVSRSHTWETMHHHASSCSSSMDSCQSKLDHLSRSQVEHLNVMEALMLDLQAVAKVGLAQVKDRLSLLESRVRVSEARQNDLLTLLQTVEDKVREVGQRVAHRGTPQSLNHHQRQRASSQDGADGRAPHQHASPKASELSGHGRHVHGSGSGTGDLRLQMGNIEDKLDQILHGTVVCEGLEYLSSSGDVDTSATAGKVQGSKKVAVLVLKGTTISTNHGYDDEGSHQELEIGLRELKVAVVNSMEDLARRQNDLYNVSIEMSDQHQRALDTYERRLARIEQSCLGSVSDLSSFQAKAISALENIQASVLQVLSPPYSKVNGLEHVKTGSNSTLKDSDGMMDQLRSNILQELDNGDGPGNWTIHSTKSMQAQPSDSTDMMGEEFLDETPLKEFEESKAKEVRHLSRQAFRDSGQKLSSIFSQEDQPRTLTLKVPEVETSWRRTMPGGVDDGELEGDESIPNGATNDPAEGSDLPVQPQISQIEGSAKFVQKALQTLLKTCEELQRAGYANGHIGGSGDGILDNMESPKGSDAPEPLQQYSMSSSRRLQHTFLQDLSGNSSMDLGSSWKHQHLLLLHVLASMAMRILY